MSKNEQTTVLPGQTDKGEYILSVLLKRSYHIRPEKKCLRMAKDRKLNPGDIHYDGPMNSSVQFESDFVPYKLKTDVVLNGNAYAYPEESPVYQITASLIIDNIVRKDILVTGNRQCIYRPRQLPEFTDPTPFETIPIIYENAYGGIDVFYKVDILSSNENVQSAGYPANHLGKGFVMNNKKEAIQNLPLPNIENPNDLITPERLVVKSIINNQWEEQPEPQGFGWVSKFWQPRASLAGVMPADLPFFNQMKEEYAKHIPSEKDKKDYEKSMEEFPMMDFNFFNGASSGMSFDYLKGNETIRLTHLHPDGEISFQLPGGQPKIDLDIGIETQSPDDVVLHTIMICIEQMQVDLVWRKAFIYPGPEWLKDMKKMEVTIL